MQLASRLGEWLAGRMSDINDYLIDQGGKNWGELLSGWRELLPPEFTLWMVNRFGDVILVLADESVHFLDVGIGQLNQIADSREIFFELIDQGDNASNWLMIENIDRCVAAGMHLKSDQCYSYKIPPVLGGSYGVENFELTDLSVHYAFLADIWRQTKDVPDGTKVRTVVVD
jgi:hypothetical protein